MKASNNKANLENEFNSKVNKWNSQGHSISRATRIEMFYKHLRYSTDINKPVSWLNDSEK